MEGIMNRKREGDNMRKINTNKDHSVIPSGFSGLDEPPGCYI